MGGLFSSYQMREAVLRNRVGVAPMCQYSSEEGFATDWHLVHLGAFATGGAGLVMTQAAAVVPEGRISPHDLGIWDDAHVEFLSPLANQRTDRYGGSFENRIRLPLEVVSAVREVWPERLPLVVRISATDWTEGGWDLDQSVELARRLREHGVDLVDCSSGGMVPNAEIEIGPGYQVPFAERIRREAGIPTGAVGLITEPEQAEAIIREGKADLVFLARELLREPRWPLLAAHQLGAEISWPARYERARPR